jgi:hypothetical protein
LPAPIDCLKISYTHIPHSIKIAAPIAHIVCSSATAFITPAFFDGAGAGVAATVFMDIRRLRGKLLLNFTLVATSETEEIESLVADKVVEREFAFDEEESVTVVDAVPVWDSAD